MVILVSWGIAFFEYCFQVPANRIGYGAFFRRPAQDDSGSHYLECFRHLFMALPR
ncbi:MAG: DMT family protein [Asticcacaulis sp.]